LYHQVTKKCGYTFVQPFWWVAVIVLQDAVAGLVDHNAHKPVRFINRYLIAARHVKSINKGSVHGPLLYGAILPLVPVKVNVHFAAIVLSGIKNRIEEFNLERSDLFKISPVVVLQIAINSIKADHLGFRRK